MHPCILYIIDGIWIWNYNFFFQVWMVFKLEKITIVLFDHKCNLSWKLQFYFSNIELFMGKIGFSDGQRWIIVAFLSYVVEILVHKFELVMILHIRFCKDYCNIFIVLLTFPTSIWIIQYEIYLINFIWFIYF